MRNLILFSILVFSLNSCRKKDDPVAASTTGNLTLEFTQKVDNQLLSLNDTWYKNTNGDSFKVTKFEYFISNIVLTNTNGAELLVPESYFIVNEADPNSKHILLTGLPNDHYTKVQFIIGVDALRNTSGAQTGALDPSKSDMFWNWNSGYIAAKLEGIAPQSPIGAIQFHIGGYAGKFAAQRLVKLTLPSEATISNSHTPNIHLITNLNAWFEKPNLISFNTVYEVSTPCDNSVEIADNYANMFKVDHVD